MTTEPDHQSARRPAVDETAATARLRSVSGLVGSVSTAYTAAHGHPMDHEGLVAAESARRRWSLSLRVALVAGAFVVLLAGGVVAAQIASTPGEVVSLEDADPGHGVDGATSDEIPAGEGEGGNAAGGAASGASPAPTDVPAAHVVVHVVGQVVSPGVVEVPTGSRVIDAIGVAGGLTAGADAAAVNLAREVVDGEQVYVPAPGEVPPTQPGTSAGAEGAAAGGEAGTPATPGLVDVNTATVEDLDTLPGIGPALAARIIQWRTDNGAFSSVDQLADVSGIGPAVLGKIRDLVTV